MKQLCFKVFYEKIRSFFNSEVLNEVNKASSDHVELYRWWASENVTKLNEFKFETENSTVNNKQHFLLIEKEIASRIFLLEESHSLWTSNFPVKFQFRSFCPAAQMKLSPGQEARRKLEEREWEAAKVINCKTAPQSATSFNCGWDTVYSSCSPLYSG